MSSIREKRLEKSRKEKYLDNGFLPFEASIYSKLPNGIPYLDNLFNKRKKLYKKAIKEKWTQEKYKQAVKWEYESRNILKVGNAFGKHEAYALLRDFESSWTKTANPNDPYLKNHKNHHSRSESMDRDKILKQKAEYRQRNADKIRQYRKEH